MPADLIAIPTFVRWLGPRAWLHTIDWIVVVFDRGGLQMLAITGLCRWMDEAGLGMRLVWDVNNKPPQITTLPSGAMTPNFK